MKDAYQSFAGRLCFSAMVMVLGLGCTRSVSNQFRLQPVEEQLDSGYVVTEELVSTEYLPVDILWVIDNSVSMRSSQTALRNGLANFANKYLRKESDIQIGVITTDAFVSNAAYSTFLNTAIPRVGTPSKINSSWGPETAKLNASTLIRTRGASTSQLISSFERSVMKGTNGMPEERGFESVLQFFDSNERDPQSKFRLFRKNSHRIIVFLSDEDDQSIIPGSSDGRLLFNGYGYQGKPAAEADARLPNHLTVTCPATSAEGQTLAPKSVCTRPEFLMPVSHFRSEVLRFFAELDGASDPSKVIMVAITGEKFATIERLRGRVKGEIAHERGTRYIDLVGEMGRPSFVQDIGISDYSDVLNEIGLAIEHRSSRPKFKPTTKFTLVRAPVAGERFTVIIHRKSGGQLVLQPSQYRVTGTELVLTDESVISALQTGDRLQVRYQPATVQPAKRTTVQTSN